MSLLVQHRPKELAPSFANFGLPALFQKIVYWVHRSAHQNTNCWLFAATVEFLVEKPQVAVDRCGKNC